MQKGLLACAIDALAALYAAPRELLITTWGGAVGHGPKRIAFNPIRDLDSGASAPLWLTSPGP